jgi:hypothetical protein
MIDVAYYRPVRNFIICGTCRGYPDRIACRASIARIGSLVINRFDDIVLTIEGLISNQLYLNRTVFEPLNNENSNILVITLI